MFSSLFFFVALAAPARAGETNAGDFDADAIFVRSTGPHGESSLRGQLGATVVTIDETFAELKGPTVSVMVGQVVGAGSLELSRARAELLRAVFTQAIEVGGPAFVRNLDHGEDYGFDALSVRVPVRIVRTKAAGLGLRLGLDLGVAHWAGSGPNAGKTSTHASFVLEARASAALIQNWLATGVMGQVRYDADTGAMSGFFEEGMGYLALTLSRERRLYARLYAGAEHEGADTILGLPTTRAFGGLGVEGNFR